MRYNRFSPAVRDMRRAAMFDLMKNAGFDYDYARNGGSSEAANAGSIARMPVDIWLEDDVYTFRANLPGFAPEDVAITFEDGELTIRAEHVLEEATDIEEDGEAEETGPAYIRRELFAGSYERTLSFNSPVDADNIVANFENGVLTVGVPKAEEAKPKQISVNATAKKSSKK